MATLDKCPISTRRQRTAIWRSRSASKSREPAMDDLTGRRGPDAMTRRSALLALSATMVSPGLMAQQTRPAIQTRRLNNVMIAVSNLERSTAFYAKLFGPPVRQGDAVVFRVGGAQITRRRDTPELFVPDPNGIKVQLQHTTYGYGSGARGDLFPPAPTAVARSAFQLKSINHVTLTIANGAREKEFYSDCV